MAEELTKANLKVGAVLFNASCNELVFSPKSWKKFWRRSVLSFSRKTRNAHFNSEKWCHRTEGEKARLLLITS